MIKGFAFFYIIGAIVLLAIAIVVYPTLRERAKSQMK